MMTLPTSSIITYLTNASILTSSDDEGSKENDATKRVSSNKQKYSTTLNAMQGLIMKSTFKIYAIVKDPDKVWFTCS